MKRLSLIAIILLGIMPCEAKVLSPEAAWQRAKAPENGAPALAPAVSSPVLAQTLEKDGYPTVYVFNTNGGEGFCVVSADDLATPVLGYSDNGGFDAANMPPSLMGWLNDYSRIISYARENGMTVSGAPYVPSLKTIEPIIKTKWNQNAPYNDQCPMYQGQTTLTGCVATAMAQILKSHNYPDKGRGFISYQWLNNNQELSLDFSKLTFDWDNMSDFYNSSSNEAQKQAVSTLMMACGYATEMNYGIFESSAGMHAERLVENFGYDKSIKYEQRNYYSITNWIKLLHEELTHGRSVLYLASNQGISHALIVDGYDAQTGFVHINWGWGGMCDGYFGITSLDNHSLGIGINGYSYGHVCFVGIQKPIEGHDYIPSLCSMGNFSTKSEAYSRNQNVSFLGNDSQSVVFNHAIIPMSYRLGIKLLAKDGSTSYIWSDAPYKILDTGHGMNKMNIPASLFPVSGEYILSMVFQSGDIIGDVSIPYGSISKIKLICDESELKFTPVDNLVLIKATAPVTSSELTLGERADFKTNLNNSGNIYRGSINIGITPKNSEILLDCIQGPKIEIKNGENRDLSFSAEVPNIGISEGEYRIAVYSDDFTRISDFTDVSLKGYSTDLTIVSLENFNIPNSDGGDGSSFFPFLVYTEPFIVTATLKCSRGYFDNIISFNIWDGENITPLVTLGAKSNPIKAGQSTTVTISSSLPELKIGNGYYLNFNGDISSIMYYLKVVGTNAGIDDIRAEDNSCEIAPNPVDDVMSIKASSSIKSASVYSLSGMLVKEFGFSGMSDHENTEVGDLARGHYIVKIVMSNDETLTRRMMKK